MELKFVGHKPNLAQFVSSNRTFMELKCQNREQ